MTTGRSKLKVACPGCRQKLDVTDLEPFTREECPRCGGPVIAPKRFGVLLLEEPLGSRRGVAAYRALDLNLDREVLVRILERDAAAFGAGFLSLARRAAGVNHPGVLPIYSCGEEDGQSYVVSQFMLGGLWSGLLSEAPDAPARLRLGLPWVQAVAAGLQAAAAQGLVHGAVGPLSLFTDTDRQVKIGDFGLDLLFFGGAAPGAGITADLAGYLSPEVLSGGPASTATDIFGVGALLYHVLTGRPPCPAADGVAAARWWSGGALPELPQPVGEAGPAGLPELCLRMLSVSAAARPPDFGAVLAGLGVPAAVPSSRRAAGARRRRVDRLAAGASESSATASSRPLASIGGHRLGWVDGLIALGMLVLVALGSGLYVRAHGWPSWLVQPSVASAPAAVGSSASAMPSGVDGAGSGLPSGVDAAVDGAAGVMPSGGAVTRSSEAAPGAAAMAAAFGSAASPEPWEVSAGPGAASSRPRRPQPPGMDFLGSATVLAQYLKGLPPAAVAAERERLELIGDTRDYLVRLMTYVPFLEGRETTVRLAAGAPLRGSLAYCNGKQLGLRRAADGTLQTIAWADLAFDQIVEFLDFYIGLRGDQSQSLSGPRQGQVRKEVAEDCLRAAVLCDWYGRHDQARRYSRRALESDASIRPRLARLLPAAVE